MNKNVGRLTLDDKRREKKRDIPDFKNLEYLFFSFGKTFFSNKLNFGSLLFLIFGISIFFTNCESKTYPQGERLYENFCANCHMEDGSGLKNIIPPLAGADYVKNNQELLPCIIRNGLEGEITVNGVQYNAPMAGTNRLSAFEIANIINYINTAWGNDFGYAKFEEIKEILEECPYEYK